MRGLVGMAVCVGGGARENDTGVLEEGGLRFGSGPREGGSMRPGFETGVVVGGGVGRAFRRGGAWGVEEVRWAELRAGKEGGGILS